MFKLLQNTDHWYNYEFRMRLCQDILSVMFKNVVKQDGDHWFFLLDTLYHVFLDLLMAQLIFFTKFHYNFLMFNFDLNAILISLIFTEYQIYTEKRKNSI